MRAVEHADVDRRIMPGAVTPSRQTIPPGAVAPSTRAMTAAAPVHSIRMSGATAVEIGDAPS